MEQENTENNIHIPSKLEDKKRRKQRSIGLLADRILKELPFCIEKDENGYDYQSWEMTVDQIANKLESRVGSVYEVFLVFESLLLASKIGPKTYRWNGFAYIRPTLSFLQYIGMHCLNLPKEMEEVQDFEIDAILKQRHQERIKNANNKKLEVPSITQSLWPGMEELIGEQNQVLSLQSKWNAVNEEPGMIENETGDAIEHQNPKLKTDQINWRQLKKDPEFSEKTPHILQVIQKFLMLHLVPSRIHQRGQIKKQRALSLSFASKVIHGVEDLPEAVLLTRARRLYDISNILVSITRYVDRNVKEMPWLGLQSGKDLFAMEKVRLPNGNSVRRATVQYQGPDVEPCQITDIMQLPDYRREYLYFSAGKSKFGIPERPKFIPRTTTVRLSPVNEGDVQVIPSEGLNLSRLAITDLKKPISLEDIVYLESCRRNVTSNAMQDDSTRVSGAEIDPKDLWLALIPGQNSFKECFQGNIDQYEILETIKNV